MPTYDLYNELFRPVAAMVFVWGLIWGSFLNVCIYRIPRGKSISFPGSHCYHCGSFLKWYDNIPLISYLLLHGNCRSCGTHFSMRYFFVELLTGCLFLAVFLTFGFDVAVPFHMVFIGLLIIGVFTDIDHFIIPDSVTLGGAGFALATVLILGGHAYVAHEYSFGLEVVRSFEWNPTVRASSHVSWLTAVGYALFSGAFGYGMLWSVGLMGKMLFRKEAMGMGDVKLFGFLGLYLGALNCIWVLFLSAFLGAIIGISLLLAHKIVGKDEIETVELGMESSVKSRWIPAISQSGEAESPAGNGRAEKTEGPIVLTVSRRTSRQLHHFPFGPYIAVAAWLVLIFRDYIHHAARNFLMMP